MIRFYWFCMLIMGIIHVTAGHEVIRINQLGYLPQGPKVAVFMSDQNILLNKFRLVNNLTGAVIFEGVPQRADGSVWGQKSAYRLDFSSVVQPGGYYLEASTSISPSFEVSSRVYKGTSEFILQYMRQQRCGFNPFLNDSCHTADGIIVDHPSKSGKWLDVTGGWHDASDYLQYTLTSYGFGKKFSSSFAHGAHYGRNSQSEFSAFVVGSVGQQRLSVLQARREILINFSV